MKRQAHRWSLAAKRLGVTLGDADLLKRAVGIERIELDAPEIDVRISKQGVVNWLGLLPESPAEAPPKKVDANAPALRLSDRRRRHSGMARSICSTSRRRSSRRSVRDIDVAVHDFDSAGHKPLTFAARWKVDAGDRLQVDQIAIRRR